VAADNLRILTLHTVRSGIYANLFGEKLSNVDNIFQRNAGRELDKELGPDFFSILVEIESMVLQFDMARIPIDQFTIFDEIVVEKWSKYWIENDLESVFGPRKEHLHRYPGLRPKSLFGVTDTWVYPSRAIESFRLWLDNLIKSDHKTFHD
jgi:hypothetical protein